jgi:hypothetical protein
VRTNWERRRFKSSSYPARGVFLTQTTQARARVAQVTFGIVQESMGSTDATSPRATLYQVIGSLTPLGLTPMSPSISLLPPRCALDPPIPGLNYITRLRGRNGLSRQLSVRLHSTWLKDVQRSALNDSDRHSFAPKTWSVSWLQYRTPARSQFIFQHGSFSR